MSVEEWAKDSETPYCLRWFKETQPRAAGAPYILLLFLFPIEKLTGVLHRSALIPWNYEDKSRVLLPLSC